MRYYIDNPGRIRDEVIYEYLRKRDVPVALLNRLAEAPIVYELESGRLVPEKPPELDPYSAFTRAAPEDLSDFPFEVVYENLPTHRGRFDLSDREWEVVAKIASGYTYGVAGCLLFIERATVNSHVKRIIRKLGAKNMTHAVAMCVDREQIQMVMEGRENG